MKTETVKLTQIQVNGANPRIIKDDKFAKLTNSILVFPQMLELRPIVVNDTFVSLGGNMRYRALTFISDMPINDLKARLVDIRDFQKKTPTEQEALIAYWERWQDNPTAPIIKASELSDEQQREFIIKDNVGYGEWDYDMLANDWDSEDLDDWGLDVWQDRDGGGSGSVENGKPSNGSLADRFVIPPFSILDTRKGYWQARKKMWRELIGDMGESRENTLADGESNVMASINNGVSLFDPVLAEICCKWFTPSGNSKIYDCFAGDTQKGFVFGNCGHEFIGIELRQEQVDVNEKVLAGKGLPVKYICDDGQNVDKYISANSQDLFFSCPPYYDIEVYSDNPNDASNQPTYEAFIDIIEKAFTSALCCLQDNRFAIVVVGDMRDKNGIYHDFVGDIKHIFISAGLHFYNEMILVEAIGTLPLRVQRYMRNRKIGKCHQNVLVFYKGDAKDISKHFPIIDFTDEEEAFIAEEMKAEKD